MKYPISATAGITAIAAMFALAGCSGGASSSPTPQSAMPVTDQMQSHGHRAKADDDNDDDASVLKQLKHIVTIGSTVDPINGGVNPYGLDVAKATAGLILKGDLVVCNFNDSANVQGTGESIIALHPVAGSSPTAIAESPTDSSGRHVLTGCDALATGPTGNLWTAAFGPDNGTDAGNDNPIFSPSGTLLKNLSGPPFDHPFGQIFARVDSSGVVFYESNARGSAGGSIVRITVDSSGTFHSVRIAKGFAINNGVPGSILGPSGLQYDLADDRLYVIDGANNTVVALNSVSTIAADGITVNAGGTTFSGPFAADGRLVFKGKPLNGPISSALLPDGHLVIGNTLNPHGNFFVEIAPDGKLLAVKNVDTGVGGALFGMVATGTSDADTKIYFNDDNDNTVKVLTH